MEEPKKKKGKKRELSSLTQREIETYKVLGENALTIRKCVGINNINDIAKLFANIEGSIGRDTFSQITGLRKIESFKTLDRLPTVFTLLNISNAVGIDFFELFKSNISSNLELRNTIETNYINKVTKDEKLYKFSENMFFIRKILLKDTLETFAKKVGVAKDVVLGIEHIARDSNGLMGNNRKLPLLEILLQICNTLDVELWQLLSIDIKYDKEIKDKISCSCGDAETAKIKEEEKSKFISLK